MIKNGLQSQKGTAEFTYNGVILKRDLHENNVALAEIFYICHYENGWANDNLQQSMIDNGEVSWQKFLESDPRITVRASDGIVCTIVVHL